MYAVWHAFVIMMIVAYADYNSGGYYPINQTVITKGVEEIATLAFHHLTVVFILKTS